MCFQLLSNKINNFKQDEVQFNLFRELPNPPKPDINVCKLVNESERFDCFPEDGANQKTCELRGCCWLSVNSELKDEQQEDVPLNVPYCFFPPNYNKYSFINISEAAFGIEAILERKFRSPYPDDVNVLKMTFRFETKDRLHVKVSKPVLKSNVTVNCG